MLQQIFANVFNISITVSVVILVVLIARACMYRVPAKYRYLLWAVVALRLLIPAGIASPVSVFNYIGMEQTQIPRYNIIAVGNTNESAVDGQANAWNVTLENGAGQKSDAGAQWGEENGSVQPQNYANNDVQSQNGSNNGVQSQNEQGSSAQLQNYANNGDQSQNNANSGDWLQHDANNSEWLQNKANNSDGLQNDDNAGTGGSKTNDITASNQGDGKVVAQQNDAARSSADAKENPVMLYGAYIWFLGVAAFLLWNFYMTLRMKKCVATAVKYRDNIYECDNIPSPFVMGLVRPHIYIPFRLEENEREYILAHEQYHIKRRDYLVKVLALLLLCVYWFHPLVWVAYFLMVRDMEMSCDEWVLQNMKGDIRQQYSRSLLGFATNRRGLSMGLLAFGESDTRKRVKNIMRFRKQGKWIGIVAVIVILAVGAICLTDAKKNNTTEKTTQENETAQNSTEENAGWKDAYATVLKDQYETNESKNSLAFLVRDLDGDGQPELILNTDGVELTLYTYTDKVVKIETYDFQSDTLRLMDTGNPAYPGLIYQDSTNGNIFYGYLSIENQKLAMRTFSVENAIGLTEESEDESADEENLDLENASYGAVAKPLKFWEVTPDNIAQFSKDADAFTRNVQTKLNYQTKGYSKNAIKILYPELLDLDAAVADTVNEKIKGAALEIIDSAILNGYAEDELAKDISIDVHYSMQVVEPHIISICFTRTWYQRASSHPWNSFYTINVDLETGEEIKLSDMVVLDENLVQTFQKVATYVNTAYAADAFSETSQEGKEFAKAMKKELQNYKAKELKKKILNGTIPVYLVDGGFGISIETYYAAGNYANFEVTYADLGVEEK